jgi:hypothetical protein
MASNPDHRGSFTYRDFSEEDTTFSIHFGPITALTIAAFLTQFGAFRTATNAILKGTLQKDEWTGDATRYSAAAPTDPDAQRERKFLVFYEGTTSFSQYNFEMGTADLTLTDVLIPGTDEVDLTQTEIAAWVTAFEALGKTPYQEAVNVTEIQAVGKRN